MTWCPHYSVKADSYNIDRLMDTGINTYPNIYWFILITFNKTVTKTRSLLNSPSGPFPGTNQYYARYIDSYSRESQDQRDQFPIFLLRPNDEFPKAIFTGSIY